MKDNNSDIAQSSIEDIDIEDIEMEVGITDIETGIL